jgi:Uma2 family endonuclease
MATRSGIRFVADDIWDAPEDGNIYEVIDGELYVSPAPSSRHQHAITVLVGYLYPYIYSRGLGKIFTAPIGVVLGVGSGVEPDLVFISRERLGIVSERGIEGAPDLVVEVLSPRTESRDRGIKMRQYAAAGVPHYRLLAGRTSSLEAYRLGAEGYELVGIYGPEDTFKPELFPGLEIRIADLWS